jgi:FAD synthase
MGATVQIDADRWVPAAVSIGRRQTFYAETGQRLLEAHLLDINEDLYGRRICVELGIRPRPERTLDNLQSLTEQLHQDVQKSTNGRSRTSHHPRPRPTRTQRRQL